MTFKIAQEFIFKEIIKSSIKNNCVFATNCVAYLLQIKIKVIDFNSNTKWINKLVQLFS